MVYNIIMNTVIQEVFSNEDINVIKKIIDKNKEKAKVFDSHPVDKNGFQILFSEPILIRDKILGRVMMKQLEIPLEILKKVEQKVNNIFNNSYELIHTVSYFEYDKKYGNPKLGVHKDANEEYVSMHADYQLDSNVDWPINVEGTDIFVANNEIIIFDGYTQNHSRPVKKFNDGEFVKMLMFRFKKVDNV
jgi:hypothetical protein